MTENCSMNDGPTCVSPGPARHEGGGRSRIVDRDVQLAQQIPNARLHVAHLSTADALKAVRRGKRAQARVTCEVTPHHFTLTDEDVGDYDTNCKMNPPLRSAAEIERFWSRWPTARSMRSPPITPRTRSTRNKSSSSVLLLGSPGWRLRWAWRSRNCIASTRSRSPELSSCSPPARRACSICADAGRLARGSHADVTIFDPKKRWTFDAAKSRSLSRNSPFDGGR